MTIPPRECPFSATPPFWCPPHELERCSVKILTPVFLFPWPPRFCVATLFFTLSALPFFCENDVFSPVSLPFFINPLPLPFYFPRICLYACQTSGTRTFFFVATVFHRPLPNFSPAAFASTTRFSFPRRGNESTWYFFSILCPPTLFFLPLSLVSLNVFLPPCTTDHCGWLPVPKCPWWLPFRRIAPPANSPAPSHPRHGRRPSFSWSSCCSSFSLSPWVGTVLCAFCHNSPRVRGRAAPFFSCFLFFLFDFFEPCLRLIRSIRPRVVRSWLYQSPVTGSAPKEQ